MPPFPSPLIAAPVYTYVLVYKCLADSKRCRISFLRRLGSIHVVFIWEDESDARMHPSAVQSVH